MVEYPTDARNFDNYPDEKAEREPWTRELAEKWDSAFVDF